MHACALTFQMFGILIKLSLRYKNVCVTDPTGKKSHCSAEFSCHCFVLRFLQLFSCNLSFQFGCIGGGIADIILSLKCCQWHPCSIPQCLRYVVKPFIKRGFMVLMFFYFLVDK